MTIEEKAKAYDEAIEKVKPLYGRAKKDDSPIWATYEYLFPQLCENENEKIRKELLAVMNDLVLPDEQKARFNTWLERQKDADKAIEAVEKIDKYIDEHLANAHDMKDSNPDKKYYRGWDDALGEMSIILQDVYSGEKQKEQRPVEGEWPSLSNCIRDCKKCQGKCFYRKEPYEAVERINLGNEFENQVSRILASVLNGEHEYNEGFVKYAAQSLLGYAKQEQKPAEVDEYEIIKKHITEDVLSSEVNKRLKECGWYVTDEKPEERNKVTINGEPIPTENQSIDIPLAEWSEEDEERFMELISLLKDAEDYLKEHGNMFSYNPTLLINWLKSLLLKFKKQEEQEPTDKIEPKFNIGDTIINKKSGDMCTIADRCLLYQYYSGVNHCREINFDEQDDWELVEQEEQGPVEGEFPYNTPADTIEGEIENIWNKLSRENMFAASKTGFREVILHFVNYAKNNADKGWSEEDERKRNGLIKGLQNRMGFASPNVPFTREEYIAWLESLPERFNLQPKQEWSEEDEIRMESCIMYLANARDGIEFSQHIGDNAKESSKKEIQKDIDWLKYLPLSLKRENERNWRFSIPDYINPSALNLKNEWSEDDDEAYKFVTALINSLIWRKDWVISKDKCLKMLEALRLQPHMVSIKNATKFGNLEYERGVKDGIQSEKSRQQEQSVAERFARIVRGNLIGIDKEVQQKFEQLYFEVTGNKMYGGYND